MRLSTFTPTPAPTMGHWVLTGLAIGLLGALTVFFWWFGPAEILLGFAGWALASVPLLLAAYSRTRSRALRRTAIVLFLASVVIALTPIVLDRLGSGVAVRTLAAVLTALPFMITIWWLARLHRGHAPADTPPRTKTRAIARLVPVLAGAILLMSAAVWSSTGLFERVEDPSASARYIGCYEVRFERWSRPAASEFGVSSIVPARLLLDSTRGASALDSGVETISEQRRRHRELGRRLVRPGWRGAAYWTPIEDDRLQLEWTTGYYGITMNLRPQGDELRGVATYHTDFIGLWPPVPRAPVRLVRVNCSLIGPDSARSTSRPPT